MGRTSRRLLLSACSLFIVLALAAGGTFAWLSDTVRVDAVFEAGTLDLVLTPDGMQVGQGLYFSGLRPLTREQLEECWAEQGSQPAEGEACYFQPVQLTSAGSLASFVTLSIEEQEADTSAGASPYGDQVLNFEDNGAGGLTLGEPERVDCQNALREDIRILLYTCEADGSLKPVEQNGQAVALWEEGQAISYTLPQALASGETKEYILAAQLPETTEDKLFGQHFHAKIVANAIQTDSSPVETVTVRDLPVSYVYRDADGSVLYRAAAKRTLANLLPGEVWVHPDLQEFDSGAYALADPKATYIVEADETGAAVLPDGETELLFELTEK
ncbi:TasA family protein [Clostridium sp. D33t1_170424_F3]|uniref:TasA family protein n=1 Tax=Clostridium sp. D33t1_170424_F3 TaxID=2787099 RepID=UPI0018AAB5C7|nr:TasA family protein [Clostridium sp. D33t1_170424_F3]